MELNEQTTAALGVEADPVSGNEVPAGALPSEVRDDVDAKLSEGEYVVPADVLRYYGVKFFEGLRDKAKVKLSEMDADGRIGGEPVEELSEEEDDMPFSLEELSVVDDAEVEMSDGGLVKGYADGGVVEDPTKMVLPDFLRPAATPSAGGTDEYITFRNAEGMTMSVRFVNGKPLSYIPPGYTEVAANTTPEVKTSISESSNDKKPVVEEQKERIDYTKMSLEELTKAAEDQSKGEKVMGMASKLMPGPMGMVTNLAMDLQSKEIAKAAMAGFNSAEDDDTKSAYENIFNSVTGSDKKGKGITGGMSLTGGGGVLQDTDKSGKVGFGDTYLGDLLGFDGSIGAQGASMQDSLQGARRTGGTGSKSSDLSSSSSKNTSSSSSGGKNTFSQSVANFFTPNDGVEYRGGKKYEGDKLVDD